MGLSEIFEQIRILLPKLLLIVAKSIGLIHGWSDSFRQISDFPKWVESKSKWNNKSLQNIPNHQTTTADTNLPLIKPHHHQTFCLFSYSILNQNCLLLCISWTKCNCVRDHRVTWFALNAIRYTYQIHWGNNI